MAAFSIGDAEKITGVKAHVLRYWEETVPLLSPQKDTGRRVYSSRDIQLILRLKYLIYEKKFTVEGAGEQLLAEAIVSPQHEALRLIKVLKSDLLELYGAITRAKEQTSHEQDQN